MNQRELRYRNNATPEGSGRGEEIGGATRPNTQCTNAHCSNGANGDSPGQRPGNERPTQTTKPHRVRTEPLDELVTISGVGTPILWFGRMHSDRLRLPAAISLPRLHSTESKKRWIQVFRRLHFGSPSQRVAGVSADWSSPFFPGMEITP